MITIDIYSDYVCPFCLIAEELIGRAIEGRDDVVVRNHPFELRPCPTPTLRPEDEYLPRVWQDSVYPMAHRFDVPLRLPTVSPQPYTETAFRGSYYAEDHGVGAAYHRRMLTAFFRENADLGDRSVLQGLAADVGLDPAQYDQALDASLYADRHARELQHAYELGIQAVPTLFIGNRRINGVATPGVITRTLDTTAA